MKNFPAYIMPKQESVYRFPEMSRICGVRMLDMGTDISSLQFEVEFSDGEKSFLPFSGFMAGHFEILSPDEIPDDLSEEPEDDPSDHDS